VTTDENASFADREDSHSFEDIIAKSALMARVVETIKKVAPTDSDVLIIGETGAGKELVARAIHRLSRRHRAEFVPVDCVAVPSTLLESELFGHEKGAFTGAAGRRRGLLEIAHHGTLFLDEISELEINLQAKLLRVLQERQFRHLGSNELIGVDVRVIAAMNRSPRKALRDGRLRQDLYYRLNVIPIRVPPLRCRREDIPLLVNHFMQLAAERYRFAPKQISPSAMELLQNYRWPGNVRQLKNVIERLMSLSPGPVIDEHDLTASIKTNSHKPNESIISLPFNEARKRKLESFEKKYFRELMKACHDDIAQAARMAGISERTIYRMINRYGKS
jgi:transcriptional regulator with PAS, ATPase and Fis domain